jgi:hypothetical protein
MRSLMIRAIYFEIKRILNNKKNNLILLLFLIFSFYLVFAGVIRYKSFKKENENFIEYEKLKFQQYVTVEQYGGYGFRVLFNPPPLDVFFNSGSNRTVESNIDNKEVVKLNNSMHGRSFFSDKGYFRGFFDFFLFFGGFLFLYIGMRFFKSLKSLNFYKSIFGTIKDTLIRLLAVDFFAFLIFLFFFAFSKFMGVNFSNSDFWKFCILGFYLSLLLAFFYILGTVVAIFTIRSRRLGLKIGLILWLLLVVIIPEMSNKYIAFKSGTIHSSEKTNIEKLQATKEFELEAKEYYLKSTREGKRDKDEVAREIMSKYINEIYPENIQKENKILDEIKNLVLFYENQSIVFPTNYYRFLSGEISADGYSSYFAFLEYIMKMRDDFMRFYIKERYYANDRKVESFIKGEENVFRAESRLPGNFWAGVGITGLYCLVLFGLFMLALQFRLNKRIKDRERVDFDFSETERGRFYFVLCKDDAFRDRLFHQLSLEPGVVGLDQVRGEDIDPELPPGDIVPYFCHLWEVKDIEKANAVAEQLGIEEIKYFKYKKSREVGEEDLKKLYAAVLLTGAAEGEIVLINDFLAGVKRTFEHKFIAVLQEFIKQDKTVVYLSTEMFMSVSASKFNELDADMDFDIQEVDLEYISLR